MNLTFNIIQHNSLAWKNAVALREAILRKPLGSIFTQQELEEEQHHIQIAGFLNEVLIATAVLVKEEKALKMQRVAVDERYRNLLVGSKMMAFCERLSLELGINTMYCHARNTAVKFYLNNGYITEGEYFDEDGIPHVKMVKSLS